MVILHFFKQYFTILSIFDEINAALLSIRDLFQKRLQIFYNSKHLNGSVYYKNIYVIYI